RPVHAVAAAGQPQPARQLELARASLAPRSGGRRVVQLGAPLPPVGLSVLADRRARPAALDPAARSRRGVGAAGALAGQGLPDALPGVRAGRRRGGAGRDDPDRVLVPIVVDGELLAERARARGLQGRLGLAWSAAIALLVAQGGTARA